MSHAWCFFAIPSRRNLSLTSLLSNSVAGPRPVLERGKSQSGVNWLPFAVAEVLKPSCWAGRWVFEVQRSRIVDWLITRAVRHTKSVPMLSLSPNFAHDNVTNKAPLYLRVGILSRNSRVTVAIHDVLKHKRRFISPHYPLAVISKTFVQVPITSILASTSS